jgi:hypothetical protein
MAASRTKPPLVLTPDDRAWLESPRRSRTDPRRQVERAEILNRYGLGRAPGRFTARPAFRPARCPRCLDKALAAAHEDLPRPGRPRQLTDADRTWIIGLAGQKPRAFGYAEELWPIGSWPRISGPQPSRAAIPRRRTSWPARR